MNQNEKYPLVSVVLAAYNGKEFLEKCITSLYDQEFEGDLEILFVDDNSQDGSYEFVKENFPQVTAIKNPKNLGHAEASNRGIEKARGDYIFLIDHDTEFESDCIAKILQTFQEHPNAGCVGGMIKDYGDSGIIQEMGMKVDVFGYGYSSEGSINGFSIRDEGQYNGNVLSCFYTSSCALMIDKETLTRTGMFDPVYFLYKDDIDLCWRVHLIGKDVLINPGAKVYHKMGSTLGGTSVKDKEQYSTSINKRYLGERNTIYTLLKNYRQHTLVLILPLYAMINIAEMLFFLFTLNFKIIDVYLRAWQWNLSQISRIRQMRRDIYALRKVGDWAVIRKMMPGSAKLKALFTVGIPNFKDARGSGMRIE